MNASEIRNSFLEFFKSKQHLIVPSAPMVVKNDPTLMFTNAGMNQFKEIFLGNAPIKAPRIADSQKCLRVSGKHNDLEEVGLDTYHHTMFEMLGNWSFGDYFKQEAIDWAWEYLTDVLKINKEDLYVTVFEGDKTDGTEFDQEAFDFWKQHLPEDRILNGNKKDNFWEMGETGPCGPCSEIHIDIRSADEKAKTSGKDLVNADHPQVIEIWNNVFIQYNRKASGELELLPAKHVDTGMGFERLCMVVQGKQSNYDTDVFQPIIGKIAKLANTSYGKDEKSDIAMRVIADHIRTIAFAITDGQLPSNNKAGYVIRRILRRAVRYGYTFLGQSDPFMYTLIPTLIEVMGDAYPELKDQQTLIEKVIQEEESSFLRTLETGIKLLEKEIEKSKAGGSNKIEGKQAFVLYDTYGFPFDLTQLILRENNFSVSEEDFQKELEIQKTRSRQATKVTTDDWVTVAEEEVEEFVGYDYLETKIKIVKYRKVNSKGKDLYQIVFNHTPFYAESGGQVGDTGYIEANGEKLSIIDTQKENSLIIHIAKELPKNIESEFTAVVSKSNRNQTAANHTATHLLHLALQQVLGSHVEQKGSLVEPDRLRFDFAHFQKMTDEEIKQVEDIVNSKIRENIQLNEQRAIPIEKAQEMGAKALFGEKYGDVVRVIQYGDSIELCGGTHVAATGQIGFFKILSEGAIAAGVRRIEAITADKADAYINKQLDTIKELAALLKNPKNLTKSVESLIADNVKLSKQIEVFEKDKAKGMVSDLKAKIETVNGINFLGQKIDVDNAGLIKDIAFALKDSTENIVLALGAEVNGKANITIAISKDLIDSKGLNAGQMIREVAKEIQGGGGGQPFYASAGGKNPAGIDAAISKTKSMI